MATTPRIDDTGVLALGPARVNIFAKPESDEGERSSSGERAAGMFDGAAACVGVAAPDAGSWCQRRSRHGARVPARWRALLVPLIAVATLVASLAAHSPDEGAADRARPRLQRASKPPASDRPKRRPPTERAATARRPARKRAKPHRAPRPQRRSRSRPQTPPAPPAPIAPRATRRRSAPRSTAPAGPVPAPAAPLPAPPVPLPAPAGPLPAPVPPDSPPEFM
jgi:hypothetical protein